VLLIQAVVLALIQGIASFLPVSASGHRDGVLYLAAWEPGSAAFQAVVHLGALAAVVLYFRGDLAFLVTRSLTAGHSTDAERRLARRTVGLLAIASVPALVVGWWFTPTLLPDIAHERQVAAMLYLTALLLVGAEALRRRRVAVERGVAPGDLTREEGRADPGRHEGTTTVGDAISIGLVQALAVLPGLSRTGATIAAGMALGLSRAGAARLSLLLSIPVLAGATIAELSRVGTEQAGTAPFTRLHLVVALLVAVASGYWAIRFLLRLVNTQDLLGFARWLALFATLLLFASYLVIG
jgi:undecaprenyl-diphosphatase